ncbi:glycosyltransferase [Ornithinimicrobium sp. W1665]|uniref:glycosyltransferase n=1 Tax=Ornithinimicrobium sp. W1665 TaxID=3416666 RepID=UPI003CF2E553
MTGSVEPLRVLLVTALVAGGVGRHVQMLAAGLAADGHHVAVACPPEVADRFDLDRHARVVPLPVGAAPHPLRDGRSVRTLRAAAAGAHVVHAHGLRAGALGALARRAGPPSLVVTTHNATPERGAARLLYTGMERLVAARADLVLGVSPDLVRRARSAGARAVDLAVVPAPPCPRLDGADARDHLRRVAGLDPGATVVLLVGRLAAQKGLNRAVAALDRLNGPRPTTTRPGARPGTVGDSGGSPTVHLVVAGEGPERDALTAAARVRADLHLLGHRDDVPRLLAGADVVLSTARWEGQPVWLQEALQQGAAVVATDVGGTGLVVGDAAALVPDEGDDEQVAAAVAVALGDLLGDPAALLALRHRATDRAAQLPTGADALTAALTAYRGVLADHPRTGPSRP